MQLFALQRKEPVTDLRSSRQFLLLSGEADLTEYRFNKKVIQHLFCRHCGVQPFGRGQDPATGAETVAINVRTLAGVDVSKLTLTPFDGKNW